MTMQRHRKKKKKKVWLKPCIPVGDVVKCDEHAQMYS